MQENIPLVFLSVALLIYVVLAIWIGGIASDKGRNGVMWAMLSMVTSPVVAFLALLVVGESEESKERANAARLLNERAMKQVLDEGFDGSAEALIAEARSRNPKEAALEERVKTKWLFGPSDAPKTFEQLPFDSRVALFVCLGLIIAWPILIGVALALVSSG